MRDPDRTWKGPGPDPRPLSRQNHIENVQTVKRRIQDHPEWSANLADRCILEPAITAGVWVERDKQAGQTVLVWREKRRDGSPGATRRRLLKQVSTNGKKLPKVRWQYAGQKTDEPFYYIGTLDELKSEIAAAEGFVTIVEGEVDVWSLQALGIGNVIGIYGITTIPRDIDVIFNELGVSGFVYCVDNDEAGERGASNLRTLLHGSSWKGKGDYRKFAGPGISDKGDANDLLRHHYPDISQARAALDALPRFSPNIKRTPVGRLSPEIDHDRQGWDAVKETIRIALGVTRFKANGYSKKNISCPNPQHDDKNPSAGWHKDGFCTCHACGGTFNSKQVAEWLGIDWRALTGPQLPIISNNNIDLDAVPQPAEAAPLSFEQTPDTWLRLLTKFYKPIDATLFHFALSVCRAGPLAQGFTRQAFINAARQLGCQVSERAVYNLFQDVFEHDNHPLFAKLDPSEGSSSRNCKFRLRSLEDIRRRLVQGISYRVYEDKFREHRDTLIGFKAFSEALLGSKFAKTLESALRPLYAEQKQRFESLTYLCDKLIASYQADLEVLSCTPLPDWTIDKPTELPALLARAIYEADPEDRSKAEWARLLGISKASVGATLTRAGIQRRAYTMRVEVDSNRDALDQARNYNARITGVEVDGSYLQYEAAMDIPEASVMILQPPSRHEIVSEEKPVTKAPSATPRVLPPTASTTEPADNMKPPGNWRQASWDPQFIYWELVKACCLLHGYEVKDGVGIYDPKTGEIWTNPTLEEVAALITGEQGDADPDIEQEVV